MSPSDVAMGSSPLRSILPELTGALKSFQSSSSTFRIIRTINPSTGAQAPPSPKTLLILDSSFNPPNRAHLTLAKSALHASHTSKHLAPFRLLLLFSTQNADKAPSAASFPERLSLMTIFAEDLVKTLQSSGGLDNGYTLPVIDIGVTTAPYYTDKSIAIETEGRSTYPDKPVHIHMLGFDTLTRIFAAKYYPKFDPPFSALNPYFDAGHRLRVTLRPSDDYGTIEQQQTFLAKLRDGEMAKDGGKRQWAAQVEMVEAVEEENGASVSSTRARKAAKAGAWQELERLSTEGVARAVREAAMYESDDRGSKMG